MDIYQKRLIEAFRADCQTLITRFELSYNTHFQNFCELWDDMQFSLIFSHHSSEAALMMFCEDALCTIKQFLLNASSLKECIGALYLLYAVYYKMPTDCQKKIRITLSDWKYIMDLHQQIKAQQYLDSNYILCKLIIDRAFTYCISDNEYGIEMQLRKKQVQPKLDFNFMPEMKELAAPGNLLSVINKLSKIYDKKKNALFGTEVSNVQFYDVNTADNIIKDIRAVQSKNRIFVQPNSSDEEVGCSKQLVPSTSKGKDNQKVHKRVRLRKVAILSKIGRAFEKGLESESSEEDIEIDPLEGV